MQFLIRFDVSIVFVSNWLWPFHLEHIMSLLSPLLFATLMHWNQIPCWDKRRFRQARFSVVHMSAFSHIHVWCLTGGSLFSSVLLICCFLLLEQQAGVIMTHNRKPSMWKASKNGRHKKFDEDAKWSSAPLGQCKAQIWCVCVCVCVLLKQQWICLLSCVWLSLCDTWLT